MSRDLIARIEAATGPDRELDDAIADAIYTGKHRCCIKGLSDEAGGMWMFTYPNGSIGSSLRFTGSIDAALTLVPEGHQWSLAECAMPGRYYAELGPRKASVWSFDAQAATPALALCAAALKARLV
jgi:hypothetical protein